MKISKRREEVLAMYKKDELSKPKKLPHPFRRERDYIGEAFRQALRNGLLPKKTGDDACELCKSHWGQLYHHCDYNKPFSVLWVCNKCHSKWHKENKAIPPSKEIMGLPYSSYYKIGLKQLEEGNL